MAAPRHYGSPEEKFTAVPDEFMRSNVVLFEYGQGFLLKYARTVAAIGSRIAQTNLISNMKLLMAKHKSKLSFYLQKSTTIAKEGQDIYCLVPALGLLTKEEIKTLFQNGDTPLEDADQLADLLIEEDGKTATIRANYAPYNIGDPNVVLSEGSRIDADRWDNVGGDVIDPEVTSFVFTDAMNGCAYAITAVEGSSVKFEAWHFQSESDNFKQGSHFRATKAIRDWFGVNDYYIEDGSTNLAATNIIWNKGDGGWKMLSQKNIVPIGGKGETIFRESTSHDLNTSADISEDRLGEIHGKLLTGMRKGVKQVDADKINEGLKNLSLTSTIQTIHGYINAFLTKDKGITAGQLAIIDKLAERFSKSKDGGGFATQYPADMTEFDAFGTLKTGLSTISKPGRVYGVTYDEAKTPTFKADLVKEIQAAFTLATNQAADLNGTRVTIDPAESNDALHRKVLLVKYYMDLFSDYKSSWDQISALDGMLNGFINKKKAVIVKTAILKSEKEELFPPRVIV